MALRGALQRFPLPYLVAIAALVALALLFASTWLGIVPIESLYSFLFANVVVTIAMMAVSALGGAFVGMLVAYRILEVREFTPFERRVLEALQELRGATEDLRATEEALHERLEALEERLPPEDEGTAS